MRWVIGIAVSVALALLVGTPQAGERWDMPTAYAESNYHAENARLFAEAARTSRARELAGWYLAQLAANGLTVQAPGDKLAGELAAIGATMAAEWSAAAGADGAAIMATFEAGHTS